LSFKRLYVVASREEDTIMKAFYDILFSFLLVFKTTVAEVGPISSKAMETGF
jgi:hypothetical protein